jgi:hypothetical protein
MKYAEPRRINEIANQNLTLNQRVGSSSLSGRATLNGLYIQGLALSPLPSFRNPATVGTTLSQLDTKPLEKFRSARKPVRRNSTSW